MRIYIESKDQLLERWADNHGRVTLGSEFPNEEVPLAMFEVDGDD